MCALLSAEAYAALQKNDEGKQSFEVWAEMGAQQLALDTDGCSPIEPQLNKLVRPVFDVDNFYADYSVVQKNDIPDTLLALLATERTTVCWEKTFTYKTGTFATPSGDKKVRYCIDENEQGREMKFVNVQGTAPSTVVRLACKNDVPGGERSASVLFLLPTLETDSLNDCLACFFDAVDENGGRVPWQGEQDFDFMFPCFDATLPPTSIMNHIKEHVPGIFDKFANLFSRALPIRNVCVGEIVHGCNFRADAEGAVSSAATVAVMITYRSLSSIPPPPVPFHCTRPFVAMLVSEDGTAVTFQTIVKVTDSALQTTEDLPSRA
jgi:hypothetical protein